MESGKVPRLRNLIGTALVGTVIALVWQDEGRVMPFYANLIVVPLLFAGCIWAYYPLIIEEIDILLKKPDTQRRIVGAPDPEPELARQRRVASMVLIGIAVLMLVAVFMSGYSFRSHVGGSLIAPDGTVLTGREARVAEFRRQVFLHADRAPTREEFTKELGDAWLKSASSLAYGLQLKGEAINDATFNETCYEGTWESLQQSVASFRAMCLNISEDDLHDD